MSKRRWSFTTAQMVKIMHEDNKVIPGYRDADVNRFSDSIKYDMHIYQVCARRTAESS